MYRFREAATAIGISEAALRSWLTREKLGIWGDRPEGGWRSFTEDFILHLALTAELVSFGEKVLCAYEAWNLLQITGFDPDQLPDVVYARRDYSARFGYGPFRLRYTPDDVCDESDGHAVLVLFPRKIVEDARKRLRKIDAQRVIDSARKRSKAAKD